MGSDSSSQRFNSFEPFLFWKRCVALGMGEAGFVSCFVEGCFLRDTQCSGLIVINLFVVPPFKDLLVGLLSRDTTEREK